MKNLRTFWCNWNIGGAFFNLACLLRICSIKAIEDQWRQQNKRKMIEMRNQSWYRDDKILKSGKGNNCRHKCRQGKLRMHILLHYHKLI